MNQEEQDTYMLTQPFRELPWWKRMAARLTMRASLYTARRVVSWAYERGKISSQQYHELMPMVETAFTAPSGNGVREPEPLGIMHSYDVPGPEIYIGGGEYSTDKRTVECDHCHRSVKSGRMIQGLRFAPRSNLCGGCVMIALALIDNHQTEYEKQPAEIR